MIPVQGVYNETQPILKSGEDSNFQLDANGRLRVSEGGCNVTTVDLATDADVVVTDSPAVLLGIKVTVVMSAHPALIKDDSTTKITLPASTAAGYEINCHGATFDTNITMESNNAATGTVLVFWRAL